MTTFLFLWLAAQAVSVFAVLAFCTSVGRRIPHSHEPAVAVIVAVKGHDTTFDRFARSLFDQDYANYRVVFTVEADDDPAVAAIAEWRQRIGDQISLVVAGLAADEGQKTANLRAAVNHLTARDEVLLFADADIVVDRDWIRQLVAPLAAGKADIASGFTWVVVDDHRLPTFLLASMGAGLSTFPRMPYLNVAWGGSTALLRKTFDKLDVMGAWRGTLSDDLQLTAIAERAGCRIAAPPDVLPRSIVRTDGFAAVTGQARRWYMLFRVYVPVTYVLMLSGTTFLAAGWLAAIAGAALGSPLALAVLGAGLGCAVLRNVGRGLVVWRLWGRAGVKENLVFLMIDPLIAPFASIANAGFAWSALAMHRTTWAGITYDLRAPQKVKVLSR
jgi:ceramide glucosyltransferase